MSNPLSRTHERPNAAADGILKLLNDNMPPDLAKWIKTGNRWGAEVHNIICSFNSETITIVATFIEFYGVEDTTGSRKTFTITLDL